MEQIIYEKSQSYSKEISTFWLTQDGTLTASWKPRFFQYKIVFVFDASESAFANQPISLGSLNSWKLLIINAAKRSLY